MTRAGSGAGWAWLVLLFVVGAAIRWPALSARFDHVDEAAVVVLSRAMEARGSFDPDWAQAGLPDSLFNFSRIGYQFAGYVRVAHGFRLLVQPCAEAMGRPLDDLAAFRLFSILCAALVPPLVVLGGRPWLGRRPAGFAGCLALVPLGLVQDGIYARPEALTTLVTVGGLALALGRRGGSAWPLLVAAGLIGLATAAKATVLPFLLLPLARLAGWGSWRRAALGAGGVGLAALAGFAAGAPEALARPGYTWAGLAVVAEGYRAVWPPFGYPDSRSVWPLALHYGFVALGPVGAGLGLLGLAAWLRRRRYLLLIGLALPVVATLGATAVTSTFHERNASHALPAAIWMMAAGWRTLRSARGGGIVRGFWVPAVAAAVALAWPAVVAALFVSREVPGRAERERLVWLQRWSARAPADRWVGLPFSPEPLPARLERLVAERGRPLWVVMPHFRGPFDARARAELEASGLGFVAGSYPGGLPWLPVCSALIHHTHPLVVIHLPAPTGTEEAAKRP